MKNTKFTLFLAIVLFATSCKKNLDSLDLVSVPVGKTVNVITPYLFNWETADFMPAPPGVNIPVPWASNTNQGFGQEIRYDYKKSDGWELVYNTFSPTAVISPKNFVLYNKYRGLLRFYLYVDPYNAPAPSDYIVHSLKLESVNGATSRHLNFAGNDLIPSSGNTTQVSKILNYKVSSTSGWYAFEYELAYDPAISSQTYQNINFKWSAGTVSVTNVNLSGQSNGTLKGTIGTPAGPPNFFGQIAAGVVTLGGLAILNNNPTLLPSVMQDAAKTALNSGFQGVVKNLFSAIFGGNSNNVQQVNLDLSTTINLAGTASTPAGLMDNLMVIPGVSNSQSTTGWAPRYNSPLGVFTLSATPKINVTRRATSERPPDDPRGQYYYYGLTIDPSSYSMIYNPVVLSSASISEVSATVIALNTSSYWQFNGLNEVVGNRNIRSDFSAFVAKIPGGLGNFAVRIAFKVTPNNGAPPVRIIKTFRAQGVQKW